MVYDSTAPVGTGKGVSIQARAEEVKDGQEMIHALAALERRGWKKPLDEVQGSSIHRVYQALPERIWINTVETLNGQRYDTRVEIGLLAR